MFPIALRSLFAWARKNGVIFRNPTSRLRVGDRVSKLIQPLAPEQLAHPVEVATDPAGRLIVGLAAIGAVKLTVEMLFGFARGGLPSRSALAAWLLVCLVAVSEVTGSVRGGLT